ncbi:mannonate dehydratase [Psychromonas sp. PT13]|uniref:mannonate dehydratase n=1 Tax=Psychromonas sp. PT13 TaxID=3439547 RepID=UPI003EBE7E41
MEQTWRWYGPDDPVSLNDVRQSGATGIVTALHHIPNGDIWPIDEIMQRKSIIEAKGLRWSVVESVPVHENIKTRTGNYPLLINNYIQTLINLAKSGINTVCYNFMPVIDWTRTDLDFELEDGAKALRFDHIAFVAFELYILKRPGAESQYSQDEKVQAHRYFESMSATQIGKLTANIIAGLPGAEEGYTLAEFQRQLDKYKHIDKQQLREHLVYFLTCVMPTCDQYGVKLAIHPDDPPRPICGLPRVMSTAEDIQWLVNKIPSINNGLTMCTGSYGVRRDNNLVDMIKTYGDRIHFIHLRSTKREENPNTFHEASHLDGDVDMFAVTKAIIAQEQSGTGSRAIPMRPDHGHQMLDDLNKKTNPGYSAIGRLKGLAEVRGLEMAIKRSANIF